MTEIKVAATPLRTFVANLTEAERNEIIESLNEFETNGVIGDKAVRLYAEKYMESVGATSMVTFHMTQLAMACFEKEWLDARGIIPTK